MTTRADYTDDEWEVLLEAPALVGLAVSLAGKSGLGTVKESIAIASGLLNVPEKFAGNALVEALHTARVKHGERSAVEKLSHPLRGKTAEEIRDAALATCREASSILREKSEPSEADGYRAWTLEIADQVASAAKEGGFLGIGGERVSAAEESLIEDISRAFHEAG